MLLSLQGITHQVHTGVGVIFPSATGQGDRLVKSFSETTKVTFASLDEAEMSAYIKTGEPFDKAGGYGGCTSRFICFLLVSQKTRTNFHLLSHYSTLCVLLPKIAHSLSTPLTTTSRNVLFLTQKTKIAAGIQGPAGAFVSSLTGCYFNVMGFPIHKFANTMSEIIKDGTIKI